MHCRCPHCHNPIQIVGDNSLADIECPSCGSHFALIGSQATISHRHHKQKIAHFELLDQVGAGTFGTVWKARDTELDRIVAIKIPRAAQFDGLEVDQILREARAAANVKHSNIVRVHEVGRENGELYIVSDFITGANLKERLNHERTTIPEAIMLCATVADALHAVHEAGIVHRDLKPQNILVDLDGIPYVTDFGLAKRDAGEITMTIEGKILGTPAYMSPEQASGKAHQADRRADVYSLGVILYELLTGELPFRGECQMLIVQILRDEPPRPRSLNPRISRDLENICLKCLEKRSDARYVSTKELADDLRRCARNEPVLARPITRFTRAWRWSKRNPHVAIASAAVALSLIAGLCASTFFAVRESLAHVSESQARKEVETQKNLADRAKQSATNRLVQLLNTNGIQMLNEGDLSGSLLWFAEALSQDPEHMNPVAMARFVSVAESCGVLERALDRGLFEQGILSHNGKIQVTLRSKSGLNSQQFFEKISSGADEEIEVLLRRAATGEELAAIPIGVFGMGPPKTMNRLIISPDDRWLVTGCESTLMFQVWDLQTGKAVSPLLKHEELPEGQLGFGINFEFDSDAQFLATSANGGTRIWETIHWENIFTINKGGVARFGSNDQLLIYDQAGVQIWDVRKKQPLTPEFGRLTSIATFTGRSDRVITGNPSFSGSTLNIWLPSGELVVPCTVGTQTYDKPILAIAVSPDGDLFASASYAEEVRVWDVGTGRPIGEPIRHRGKVYSLEFSPDGSLLVTAGADGTARLWEPRTGRMVSGSLHHDSEVLHAHFVSDGSHLLTMGKNIRVWKLPKAQRETLIDGDLQKTTTFIDQSGQTLVVVEANRARLRDVSFDKWLSEWIELSAPVLGQLACADLSSDRRLLAIGTIGVSATGELSTGGLFRLWDLSSGKMVAECAVSNPTLCVRFSKNSEVVAFGTTGGFQIWETNTQQKKLEHNSDAVLDVEFVDHRLAIAGPTQLVNHDLQSGERIGVPLLIGSSGGWNSGPHLRRLIQCDEKNGRLVAVGGGNVAQVVDTRSGAALNQPLSHFDQINHISLSSNGDFLVSASDDRTAKIWKVEGGELRCQPLVHDARVMYAGFSVDSHYVFTTSDDATARLWDAETGEPVTPPLAHRMRVRQAILSADNTRLITCTLDGAFQWRVPQPTRRLDSAIDWAQVCAARRLTSSGQLAPLSTSELTEKISRLRERATSISATAVTENSQGSVINVDVLSDR